MDDELQKYLTKYHVGKNEQPEKSSVLDEVIAALNLANRFPAIQNKFIAESQGTYNPLNNTVTLNPYNTRANRIEVATHELQHSLQEAMAKHFELLRGRQQVDKNFVGLEGNRFLDAYRAFSNRPEIPNSNYSPYRNDFHEENAFGVGNYATDKIPDNRTAPHIDATQATEAAILRDLFTRSLKAK